MFSAVFNEMRKHKKLIIAYVSICMVLAVFASPFFGITEMSRVYATSEEEVVPIGETIYTLTTMFTGKALRNVAGSYGSVVGVSAEPFTALLFLGIVENINKLCGSPLAIAATPAGNPFVLLLVAIFFVASKLMKSFETTKVFGLCTLGELEKYLGLVFILALGIMNVVGLTSYSVTKVSAAAAPDAGTNGGGVAIGILSALISVFLSLVSVVIYLVVKTVFFGLDALQSCFSFIPFSGALFEVFKSVFVIVVLTINVFIPWLGVAINIIVFIICCFLFKFFVNVEEFLRKIYIKPFLARMRGFNDEIPLVFSKVPRKIRKYCEAEGINYDLALPVYAFKKKEAENYKMKFMEKVWLVNTEEGAIFLKKKMRKIQRYNLYGKEKTYYLKKDFRFIEIFSNPVDDKITKKDLRVIISIEYIKRFEEICDKLQFVNYHVYKENLKLSKKEQKLQKKEEKREARKEKINAFTTKAADKFKPAYMKLRNAIPFLKKKEAE